MGPVGLVIGGEGLLLPAIVMSAVGTGLVLLLLHRLGSAGSEHARLVALTSRFDRDWEESAAARLAFGSSPDPIALLTPEGHAVLANDAYRALAGVAGPDAWQLQDRRALTDRLPPCGEEPAPDLIRRGPDPGAVPGRRAGWGSGRGWLDGRAFSGPTPTPSPSPQGGGERVGASGATALGPEVVERGQAFQQADGTLRVEEALRTPAGLRWFAWTERAVTLPDGRPGRLRSGREVTERIAQDRALAEARERAEAASEAKSRFLATVSHEFRTPLNGILGMADLVLDSPLAPEQTTYVQAIKGSAEAFLSLIEEILDFSKIEAGRIDLVDEPFAIEPLVQGVVELLAPRAQDKGTEIACHVARDVPRAVVADRDRLRQILFNLAGNAVKFTETGGVCVSVARGPDGAIAFAVEDTGPGIPADRQASIFEEFEQGGLAVARGSGTGLGLAITRRIVARMGGRIAVESDVGRGSTFRVALPLRAAAGQPAEAASGEAEGLRVLIVGASPFEPRCIERRLVEAGAETARAGSAAEAAALMAALRFDVLLVDAALDGDALPVLAEAARRARIGRTIVLLSPFERRDLGSPAAAGFDAYLMKPVRTRSLLERLGSATKAPAAPQTRPASVPVRLPGRPSRVLLAEDNAVNALLAMKALEKLGALVDWAQDGTEALAKAERALADGEERYDLILMDMRMPGMDGAEVTRRIRERETALGRDERCRIVALTASLVGERERYRETAGFDGFLAKPFTLAALAEELRGPDGAYAAAS